MSNDQERSGSRPELHSVATGREATRYLSAAAYTDSAFCKAVLDRTHDDIRARAPEVGLDIEAVSAHCHLADRARAIRNLWVSLLSIALLVAAFASLPTITDSLDPNDPLADDLWFARPLAVFWSLAALLVTVHAFKVDGILRKRLTRGATANGSSGTTAATPDGNVTVYSGFSPFVGAGFDMGGWSFAIDLERSREGANAIAPTPFAVAELYEHATDLFKRLQFSGLQISRRLFVSGRRICNEALLLPDPFERPITYLPENFIKRYTNGQSQNVRHYLCVESIDWEGEVVVTFFIRFHKLSSKLFVELSTFLLPPLKSSFYAIDELRPDRRLNEAIALVVTSLFKALFLLAWAPFATLGRWRAVMARSSLIHQQRREIKTGPLFDYGAPQSIREMATGTEWRIYFQKLDKEMHQKMLQQQLLDGLVDFLDRHGVDTSEIKERTTQILNNGVIVSGGTINADGLAVGQNAQTKVNNVTRKGREKVSA